MAGKRMFLLMSAVSVFLLVSLAGPIMMSHADPASDKVKVLYSEAKKEGQLDVSVIAVNVDKYLQEFSKRYPGIKTSLVPATSGETVAKFIAETAAGRRPEFDVADMSGMQAAEIKTEHAAKFNWVEYGVDPAMVLTSGSRFDHRFLYWYDMTYVVSYNTQLVRPEEVPRSYEDLLDKKWEGKIAVDPRGHGIRTRAFITNEKEALDYARKLAKLKPIFASRAGAQLTKAVVSGEAAIGFDDSLDNVLVSKNMGAPIEWDKHIKKVAVDRKWYWTPSNATHPNAARLFMIWAVSDEGARIYEELSNRAYLTHEGGSKLARMFKEAGVQVISVDNLDLLGKYGKVAEEASKIFGTMK